MVDNQCLMPHNDLVSSGNFSFPVALGKILQKNDTKFRVIILKNIQALMVSVGDKKDVQSGLCLRSRVISNIGSHHGTTGFYCLWILDDFRCKLIKDNSMA